MNNPIFRFVGRKNRCILKNVFVIAVLVSFVACAGKEIQAEKVAKVTVKMIMEGKLKKEDKLEELDDALIETYTNAEGFSAADYKASINIFKADSAKGTAFGEALRNAMFEETVKAMGGSAEGMGADTTLGDEEKKK